MDNIKIINQKSEYYPTKLLSIKNPPKQLYILGDEKLLNKKSIAIVGSRDCTEYGYNQAIRFAKELSQKNICIVSGLAIGIDSAAHIGSKNYIGKTIAVLGSGFDNIYPTENIELFNEILEQGGCIVSEYSPNTIKKSEYFPVRNRIISGLSDGVLVVEAKKNSGSGITAKLAKKQGKKVYCIPGNIDSKNSYGTCKLIQDGAKLVLNSNDILEDYGKYNKDEIIEIKEEKVEIDEEYRIVYNLITKIPINVNEICKKSNKNINEVNIALTMLELQGVIKSVGINEFIKTGE